MNGSGNIYTESATVFAWKPMLRGISGMSVGSIIAVLPVKAKTSGIKWMMFSGGCGSISLFNNIEERIFKI